MRRRRSIRTGQPISASSVALYDAAVVDLFKYAARRGWLPGRFNWVEMKASAAETLGKIPTRPAQFHTRIPLLVAYVDQLSLPHVHLRKGRAHLELLRDRQQQRPETRTRIRVHRFVTWQGQRISNGLTRGRGLGLRPVLRIGANAGS